MEAGASSGAPVKASALSEPLVDVPALEQADASKSRSAEPHLAGFMLREVRNGRAEQNRWLSD
jgi:hypothetical protein